MSWIRRLEVFDPFSSFYYPPPSHYLRETSIYTPKVVPFASFFPEEEDLALALDFFHPNPNPLELFETATDLIQVEKTPWGVSSYKRVVQNHHRVNPDGYILQGLCDRVNALEERFDRVLKKEDRKYTWTAEIKGPEERKYEWVAEIKGRKKEEEEKKNSSYKWTAEIKGKGEDFRKYSFQISNGEKKEEEKKKKKEEELHKHKKVGSTKARLVEIEEPCVNHGPLVLRQAFAKRAGVIKAGKGKHKELSPQDAALMIQMTFRAYLIRRSQALRALRELAIAKAKLKELRGLFNNFSYRRLVARDAEERQKFSEKIIVLLLTVDAIDGADLMVRSAKRSMIDELEAMLDVVDPQPPGKLLSMKRRTFDMPDGVIQREIAEGVAHVVQMLDNENV